MSDEEDDELTKWRKERGIPEEEVQRLLSPELRWLELFHRLTVRVEANESRVRANEEEADRREERIQRTIEFIVQQQAQFNADMQRLRESQDRNEERWALTEERWARADARWARTEEGIRALLAIAEIHEQEFANLRQAQAEAQARTDAKMAETGERVDALVNTVERLISERRNGRGRREENPE